MQRPTFLRFDSVMPTFPGKEQQACVPLCLYPEDSPVQVQESLLMLRHLLLQAHPLARIYSETIA